MPVRTFFIFTDLPVHIEYRVSPLPLLPKGTEIRMDDVALRHPKDVRKVRKVDGDYCVTRQRLVYNGRTGFSQYLELGPVERPAGRAEPLIAGSKHV